MLPLTLDVEHAARTKLMRIATERGDEDGYAPSRDYMASLKHNERRRREGEVGMMGNDLFCDDLVGKYGGSPADMPVWVLMELFSFGSFINLYLFCAERWGDREVVHEHYMLRQTKSVRNACAHSSDILNGIAAIDTRINADAAIMAALAESGLSHRVRTAKMKNPPHQADCDAHVSACWARDLQIGKAEGLGESRRAQGADEQHRRTHPLE